MYKVTSDVIFFEFIENSPEQDVADAPNSIYLYVPDRKENWYQIKYECLTFDNVYKKF